MTRLLLVDDSELALAELSRISSADPRFEVIGTARHGLAALELVEALRPDLVTLDLQMPVMDGMTTLKHMMARRPLPAIVVSSFTTEDSHLTFDCLRLGAADFVTKPRAAIDGLDEYRSEAIASLRRVADMSCDLVKYHRLQSTIAAPPGQDDHVPRRLVVVSAGRGGLVGLLTCLNPLPPALDVAVVVVLDMSSTVVESFGRYMSRYAPLRICTQIADTPIRAGELYLASAASPVTVIDAGGPRLRAADSRNGEVGAPRVESLFASAAGYFGAGTIGVALSGASDGVVEGLGYVRSRRGACLVQPAESALCPAPLLEAVRRNGLVTRSADADALAELLFSLVAGVGR